MGTFPYATGTDVSETIGGKEYGRHLLRDADGNDAMGRAVTNPAVNTLLGRLKTIVDAVNGTVTYKRAKPITPGPTALTEVPDAIYVGDAGTLLLRGYDGGDAPFKPKGEAIVAFAATHVLGGTTCPDILALYID